MTAALLLAGCAPPVDDAPVAEDTDAAVEAVPTPDQPLPEIYAQTAWRSAAEDGARYTTYIDEDGSYRDLRNGDPWQQGNWTYDTSGKKRLCFTPEDEGAATTCWKPGRMDGDTMYATGPRGRRIALEQVDYIAPEDDGET
ncbi:hypothetical protein [Qipengyuania marisflavi]|uniref:DUF995 domain-containing protein n=1 Tax=Qipengyuania marisflavi TaxID=2486356 RepID=A0A5S3P5U1_9SPHN|nr:hypothetical protein [Qipengyuania marisflavi]TMM48397.1 hypothetical protein FEV51_08990 [Qipengyuania marisflavi]